MSEPKRTTVKNRDSLRIKLTKIYQEIIMITKDNFYGGITDHYCYACDKRPLWTCFKLHHFMIRSTIYYDNRQEF